MTTLDPTMFEGFVGAVHGYRPYPWQSRLLRQLVETGEWPAVIDLPTGSGKTTCIDVAIFALAVSAGSPVVERLSPRRIVFCVNRRVIVSAAYQRARAVADALADAEAGRRADPILLEVASALRVVAGSRPEDGSPPLDAVELRGGLYRDDRWARSATQPSVIASTVDQLGSRLLFRGYGVSDGMRPVHAGLLAHDSVVLLDEAHISRPFLQTLGHVRRLSEDPAWRATSIGPAPLRVVPMTATPPDGVSDAEILRLDESDRAVLSHRLSATKPARLEAVPTRQLVREAATRAVELTNDESSGAPRVVGVFVNRVQTARDVHELCRKIVDKDRRYSTEPKPEIHLVLGSMRPIDRDRQFESLSAICGPSRPKATAHPVIVVSTQCLEVGADLDFDAMVTESASIDALRQRFGRLNRAGRQVPAPAVILHPGGKDDPIYGDSIDVTWSWLEQAAVDGVVDLGIDAMAGHLSGLDAERRTAMSSPGASLDAPLLLPATVDLLCQTKPAPDVDVDIDLHLHGPGRTMRDVRVCWRGDLPEEADRGAWLETIDLLPPTAAECMPVPIGRFMAWWRAWSGSERFADVTGDAEADVDDESDARDPEGEPEFVVWRRPEDRERDSLPLRPRPGDIIVLPAHLECGIDAAKQLGHVPKLDAVTSEASDEGGHVGLRLDVADIAAARVTDRAVIRFHPRLESLRAPRISAAWVDPLLDPASEAQGIDDDGGSDLAGHLSDALGALGQEFGLSIDPDVGHTDVSVRIYPDGRGVVLVARTPLGVSNPPITVEPGDDGASFVGGRLTLEHHTADVLDRLEAALSVLPMDAHVEAYRFTARHHDMGKLDRRFQAMLLGGGPAEADVWLAHGLALAKSDRDPSNRQVFERSRQRAELPSGFRHEMLSVQIAQADPETPSDRVAHELALHLIASHHGHARPLAPVPGAADEGTLGDPEAPEVMRGSTVLLSEEHRRRVQPHELAFGIPDRFWAMTRRFGWWGLSYLESVLRLADQQASARPADRVSADGETVNV